VKIAIERIRFAIKVNDQMALSSEHLKEVGFQLLDALGAC